MFEAVPAIMGYDYAIAENNPDSAAIIENNLTNLPTLCKLGCTTASTASNWLGAELSGEFNDVTSDDYALKPDALSIDTATPASAPSVDLLGHARPQGIGFDLGALERLVPITPSDGGVADGGDADAGDASQPDAAGNDAGGADDAGNEPDSGGMNPDAGLDAGDGGDARSEPTSADCGCRTVGHTKRGDRSMLGLVMLLIGRMRRGMGRRTTRS